jgi:hypothetical protein
MVRAMILTAFDFFNLSQCDEHRSLPSIIDHAEILG